jgi:hypothetical protein
MNGAQKFLQDCSYSIDLGQLYKMGMRSSGNVVEETGTCVYNQNMEYTPVQLQLHQNIKGLFNNNNYLLQVWNKKGMKVL